MTKQELEQIKETIIFALTHSRFKEDNGKLFHNKVMTSLNTLEKQLSIYGVVVNEAVELFEPCGIGENICKCKEISECGYISEVEFCDCKRPIMRSVNEVEENKCRECKLPFQQN